MATRGRKLLLGCGAGCLGLIALSIGACVSFTVWINQPGELLEPTRLLGQDPTGYVEWSLSVEDPGTEAFVGGLMDLQERAQERNQRGPVWLNQLLKNHQRKNRAVRELLPAADVLLVIGSQNSSNSQRLREVALQQGTAAYLIDGPDDLQDDWFTGCQQVLLTAGASAPEMAVRATADELVSRFDATIESATVREESASFSLPKELRDLLSSQS